MRGKGSGLQPLGAMGGNGLVFDMQRFKELVRAGLLDLGDVSWDFYSHRRTSGSKLRTGLGMRISDN